jgi:hypothetical protein
MSSQSLNGLGMLAVSPGLNSERDKARPGSWFEAMAHSWGQTLDAQADWTMTHSGRLRFYRGIKVNVNDTIQISNGNMDDFTEFLKVKGTSFGVDVGGEGNRGKVTDCLLGF